MGHLFNTPEYWVGVMHGAGAFAWVAFGLQFWRDQRDRWRP